MIIKSTSLQLTENEKLHNSMIAEYLRLLADSIDTITNYQVDSNSHMRQISSLQEYYMYSANKIEQIASDYDEYTKLFENDMLQLLDDKLRTINDTVQDCLVLREDIFND